MQPPSSEIFIARFPVVSRDIPRRRKSLPVHVLHTILYILRGKRGIKIERVQGTGLINEHGTLRQFHFIARFARTALSRYQIWTYVTGKQITTGNDFPSQKEYHEH
jgi:hypothetical protein